jgi:NADPH-dependent curcumin reductase CurA
MRGAVVGKIIASKSTKYPVGCYVNAPAGWTEYAVFDDSNKDMTMIELPKEGKLTDTLGVLGWFTFFFALSINSDFRWLEGDNSLLFDQRLGKAEKAAYC